MAPDIAREAFLGVAMELVRALQSGQSGLQQVGRRTSGRDCAPVSNYSYEARFEDIFA